MIGLIVMRGYPHSVIEVEAFKHPVGLFQRRDIEQRLTAEEKSVEQWVALGESASRPIKPDNPAFHRALRHAAKAQCPIIIENVFRLYDGASKESAEALTAFLQENKYPVISAVHGKPVHLHPDIFTLLLADRMQYVAQNEQVSGLKKELNLVGSRTPAKARPEYRQKGRDRNWVSDNLRLLNVVVRLVEERDKSAGPATIQQLCDGLNDQGFLTETGRNWKAANLRKKLKRLREGANGGTLWDNIAL